MRSDSPEDRPPAPDTAADGDGAAPVFTVHLPRFDGPLDLLLHLIKRDEIDIYDIPIARITEEYLATLDLMKELDLDVAGDFLVMAATLIRIKSQMLLPRPALEEDEEGVDPREELVRRLLEYRQFKEAAEGLRGREEERRRMFERGETPAAPDEGGGFLEVSLFDLLDGLRDVLRRLAEEPVHEVHLEDVTIEEMMERIRSGLAEHKRVLFADVLLGVQRRIEAIVMFMALLELMRIGETEVRQERLFGEIWIFRGYAFGSAVGTESQADR